MPVVTGCLHGAAGENGVVLDVSDEVGQNCVLGGLAGMCRIALSKRMDSGVLR